MLLRRISEHLRAQNLFAVTLDLLVVVLGVFLAFQAERWIATGDIAAIKDPSLKKALAKFYEQSSWQRIVDFRGHQQENIVDPWIIYHFDHIALMRANHPDANI